MEKKFNSLKSQIRDVNFGKGCTVIEPSNLYECELGDNVFVGPFVEITNGVKIGDRTRISSHSFICNLVNIGKDQGVEGDSELIVKRDGIRIGNLSVVSIQPGLTVADISRKGLSKAVEPGDKVVFQKLGE